MTIKEVIQKIKEVENEIYEYFNEYSKTERNTFFGKDYISELMEEKKKLYSML